jgi:16S rRNA (cytosine967-C5)-methyltransferase
MAPRAQVSAVSPARAVAFRVLRRVFEEGAYADRALRSESQGLDDRDRALARRLAYGAVQRKRTLDHAIETLGRRPVRRLDAPVAAALRLGAYQLAFMDAVPRYAAVNESVELVRSARLERAVSFANAVLRRLAEGARALVESLPEGTAREAALRHSYPDWIAETWWTELGPDEARESMAVQNEEPETAVRLVRGSVDGRPDPAIPGAWVVDRVDEQALADGLIWPQSRASQLAGLAVGSRPGERTLDVCAAPGGKATMLAGDVDAVEIDEARAAALQATVQRLGASAVRVVHADGRNLPPDMAGYDRALVDAPCSGLGVLAARPDLRWRAEPLPALQLELLRAAIQRTRPGGTVVYSVCTINAAESEDVVDAVVAGGGVEVDPALGDEWPQFRHRRRAEFLQTLPHVHGTSGFFVARLRRAEEGT